MSALSADSPSQDGKSTKKRNRDPIWERFTEVKEDGEIKMQCNQCRDKVSKYKTTLMRHWGKKHEDQEQPRKKIRSCGAPESVEPKEKYKKVQKALSAVLSIPSLPINIFLHPLIRRLFQIMSPSFEFPKSFGTFKCILQDQFLTSQIKIKEELSKMMHRYSLTCDVWTDSGMRNSYLAIYRSLDKFEERVTSVISTKLRNLLHKRFDKIMESSSLDFDHIFFVATALDPNTACFLTENDHNIAVSEIQNLVRYEQPQQQGSTTVKPQLNTTLDQLLGDLVTENRSSRSQKTIDRADAISWIQEKLKCVVNASSSGIDPLKWWTNMLGTDAKPLAILALEVLSVPATSAPIERIF